MITKKILLIIGTLCIVGIVCVSAIKYNHNQTMKCIGENSKLFIQPGSSNADTQIELLDDDIKHFEVINCFSNAKECVDIEISKTPMWELNNNERVYKVMDIDKLKELSNC